MRTYVLDPGASTPLYEQLYRAVKEDILSGTISGGEKLPSKRTLAEHLNISRITVENAYNQLLTEGYITSRPKSGYYAEVLEQVSPLISVRNTTAIPSVPVSPPSVSAGQFPFSIWARLMRSVLLDQHDLLLQQPPNTGLADLRQAIADLLFRSHGMEVSPENIIVGAGAEYLYNILIQLLGRHRCYGLEDPGHRKIRQVYDANGVTTRSIILDDCGLSLSGLTASAADVLHISPGHQYPTGVVMPIVRRRQLMNWVAGGDRWIIEDDYDSEFRFAGRLVPTMFSMDTVGRVIYLNTFSRTITPALRISYMILPDSLMAHYRQHLGFYSCTVPVFEQFTLARFLNEGYFEKHISRMKRRYRLLRDRFLTLLRESPQSYGITVQGQEAGLHFLLRLQTNLSDDRIEQLLRESAVPAACLRHFQHSLPEDAVRSRVVLAYSDLQETDLPRVVSLLETLVSG